VLKLFDPESTEPIMNMLCDVGRNNTTTTSNDNNNLNNNNNNITAPTNLCKVAMTQYGTQFLQKFVDIADESQLSMLDTILSDDLVDIMMCSSYSGHFLMKMLKSRGNKILLSSCRGVQMLARDIANLSSNDRSSHVSAKHTFTFCLEWGIDSLFLFLSFSMAGVTNVVGRFFHLVSFGSKHTHVNGDGSCIEFINDDWTPFKFACSV